MMLNSIRIQKWSVETLISGSRANDRRFAAGSGDCIKYRETEGNIYEEQK